MTMSTMKLEMLFTVTAVELRSIGKMEFIFVHIAVRPWIEQYSSDISVRLRLVLNVRLVTIYIRDV
ncbi:MAG: hypothetical protein ACLUGH_08915 [Oscillospiraceae bacterium]